MRAAGILSARRRARALVRLWGVQSFSDLDLAKLAQSLGVQVVIGALSGAVAQLVRDGDRVMILIPEEHEHSHAAIRFAIAHELGHFVLAHPSHALHLVPGQHETHLGEARDYEAEANAFAAEILLPRALVEPFVRGPITLAPVRAIADAFGVSLLVAGRRIPEVTRAPCAAVFSTANHVAWVAPSPTFRSTIVVGARLATNSMAARFFARDGWHEAPITVPAEVWGLAPWLDVTEHATASPRFHTVLSMISVRHDQARRTQPYDGSPQ